MPLSSYIINILKRQSESFSRKGIDLGWKQRTIESHIGDPLSNSIITERTIYPGVDFEGVVDDAEIRTFVDITMTGHRAIIRIIHDILLDNGIEPSPYILKRIDCKTNYFPLPTTSNKMICKLRPEAEGVLRYLKTLFPSIKSKDLLFEIDENGKVNFSPLTSYESDETSINTYDTSVLTIKFSIHICKFNNTDNVLSVIFNEIKGFSIPTLVPQIERFITPPTFHK